MNHISVIHLWYLSMSNSWALLLCMCTADQSLIDQLTITVCLTTFLMAMQQLFGNLYHTQQNQLNSLQA